MDRFAVKGIKKLFGLTRTKIRLAEESDTVYVKPKPLPLIKHLTREEINTVEEAREYRDSLQDTIDYTNPEGIAKTVFQLLDMIEGVKYKYEPPDLCTLAGVDELKAMGKKAADESKSVNLLLMTEKAPEGINVFVGENPPTNSLHLGRVPSTTAFFLDFAFNSDYLSEGLKLRNINAIMGRKTLIMDAIYFSLGEYGARLG